MAEPEEAWRICVVCPAWDPGTDIWNDLKPMNPDNIWASLNHDVPVLAHCL